ncbi:MAG: hypothetical protein WA749_02820 [Gelidibacter sp.]
MITAKTVFVRGHLACIMFPIVYAVSLSNRVEPSKNGSARCVLALVNGALLPIDGIKNRLLLIMEVPENFCNNTNALVAE